jgi:hypothetical protein
LLELTTTAFDAARIVWSIERAAPDAALLKDERDRGVNMAQRTGYGT